MSVKPRLDDIDPEIWREFRNKFPSDASFLVKWNGKLTMIPEILDANAKLMGFIEGYSIGERNSLRNTEHEIISLIKDLRCRERV